MLEKIVKKINNFHVRTKEFLYNLGIEGNEPDFIIIGAQKAGTTSLYNYIGQYAKNFIPPKKKELHYFDKKYHKSVNWYKAQYSFSQKKGDITGEATPYYLFHPLCAQRICEQLPEVKLIVLLRNPIDRAYSHYQFEKSKGYEPLSFEKAIKREKDRLKNEKERILMKENYNSHIYQYFSYLSRGIYYDQLKEWFNYFSRDQFLILSSESFFNNPQKTLEKVFDFLDLKFNSKKEFEFKTYNENRYSSMDESVYNYLEEYYLQYNKKLYNFLDRNFNWEK